MGWPRVQHTQQLGVQGNSYKAPTAKLPSTAHPESTLVAQFWDKFEQIDSRFERNSKILFVLYG